MLRRVQDGASRGVRCCRLGGLGGGLLSAIMNTTIMQQPVGGTDLGMDIIRYLVMHQTVLG